MNLTSLLVGLCTPVAISTVQHQWAILAPFDTVKTEQTWIRKKHKCSNCILLTRPSPQEIILSQHPSYKLPTDININKRASRDGAKGIVGNQCPMYGRLQFGNFSVRRKRDDLCIDCVATCLFWFGNILQMAYIQLRIVIISKSGGRMVLLNLTLEQHGHIITVNVYISTNATHTSYYDNQQIQRSIQGPRRHGWTLAWHPGPDGFLIVLMQLTSCLM